MTLDITTLTNLLENVLEPYIELLTFGIDIAAGIVIGGFSNHCLGTNWSDPSKSRNIIQ